VARPARMPTLTEGGVMIVPVVGGLIHRGDQLDAMSGAQSYTHLNNVIMRALRMDEVKGILLDIDSPGGEAGGCFELADSLLDARRGGKPIWGIANTQACSAAYLILASCTKAFVTQSGHAGSIGVCLLHMDISKAMQQAGVAATFVYAGAHKIDGNPFEKLSKEVKADLQASIDASYTLFVDAVAERRPMKADAVRATEARVYRAEEAASLGLVDGVQSLEATLLAFEKKLGGPTGTRITHHQSDEENMTTAVPTAAPGISPEAHAQAVAEARELGRKDGRGEAAKILGLPGADKRPKMATMLAGDPDISPDKAEKLLAASPEETGGGKLDRLLSDPKVGGGDPGPTADVREARRKELAAIGAQISKR